MQWVESLNRALDYIEDNLLENPTCHDIAKHVNISSYHFQRAFYLLTGLTIGEYVRNRRLTLAGQELTKANTNVIDIALKYGYGTPESFSKAFSRFHRITPKQAKRAGENLKSFNRLSIKIIMEGGRIMDYRIEKKESFKVVVKAKVFNGENSDQGIPEFWNTYFSSGLGEKVCGTMGICGEEESNGKQFKYGIGCPVNLAKKIPPGFETWTIPTQTWAIFKCIGAMPKAIQDMWKRIYSEWLPQAEYELLSGYDIENYTDGDTASDDYISEIWISVKAK